MINILKTYLHFCGWGIFYYSLISCFVGISLIILYRTNIIYNFDNLLTYYLTSSLILWFCVVPFIFLEKLRNVDP
jgi:hypothetical protein